jgi:hypothetical protein
MKHYVGLDVSQKVTSVCIVDENGAKQWAGKCPSTPEALAAVIRERAPQVARVGLETGPLCVWHFHGYASGHGTAVPLTRPACRPCATLPCHRRCSPAALG